jgi:hypothetical protein
MQVFFGEKLNASRLSLSRARELTSRFATHYNHAVPFDEGALDDIWNRCHDLRCGTARSQAEEMLKSGSWAFPAVEQNGETGYPTPPLEANPATPSLSPEPEFD